MMTASRLGGASRVRSFLSFSGCRAMSGHGSPVTQSQASRSGRSSFPKPWRTRRSPAYRSSTGSTPHSQRSWATRCSGRRSSWPRDRARQLRPWWGPVITPLVGAAALEPTTPAKFAASLALATGFVYLALGVARMGWVSNFLSKAVMGGFVLGFAIGIIIEQSYKLLGVPKVDGSYMEQLWGTIKELPDTNLTTLALGATCLALLLLMRYRPRTASRAHRRRSFDPRGSVLRPHGAGGGGHGSAATGVFSVDCPTSDGSTPSRSSSVPWR